MRRSSTIIAVSLAGVLVALVSIFVLALGAAATGWSRDDDVCHVRSDAPRNAVGYTASPSGDPPWGVECTYRLRNGETITLPQWYPGRALPYLPVAFGLPLLYAAVYLTARRKSRLRQAPG